jgi:hypothetical protein
MLIVLILIILWLLGLGALILHHWFIWLLLAFIFILL